MLSLTQLPVCVLRASLHYSWHLWFHALHTPHGRSFSSSDSSSLLSPPFINQPLCSITILINLTSAHIRTAVSLSLLRKTCAVREARSRASLRRFTDTLKTLTADTELDYCSLHSFKEILNVISSQHKVVLLQTAACPSAMTGQLSKRLVVKKNPLFDLITFELVC